MPPEPPRIAASEGLFRFGIVSLFAVIALGVVVAWALYRVFRPVIVSDHEDAGVHEPERRSQQ
jgi:flagellar biogenesis protein FliO